MERKLIIGSDEHTEVHAIDERGAGNANHEYIIVTDPKGCEQNHRPLTEINFQNGPIKENGINGIHNEDLIAIVIDRLDGFQSGEYACQDNADAATCLSNALAYLRKRTDARKARGVEGTSVK
jgi:hypothetical protein